MTSLTIKNMVCNRCVLAVKQTLEQLNIPYKHISLGEAELLADITPDQKVELDAALHRLGFEILDDKKAKLIERIKVLIIDCVHHQNGEMRYNLSELISNDMHHDYNYLSNLFSEVEGTTIEKYYIAQKIEKVKELLVYDELTLSEIAFKLNYSSTAYLSNQFKKITGMTPGNFRKYNQNLRKALDKI